jgi:hypothetical protein
MSTVPRDTSFAPVPPVVPGLDPEAGIEIDYDSLITEDHKPVDRIYIEKLCRLLTRPLYASWPGPGASRPFLVLADVGWFYQAKNPAVVPDVLLSLDVTVPTNLHIKQGHSYYQWDMGKPPDVIIEAVSDKVGGEESFKKDLYAQQGVSYYVVFDPSHLLSADTLRTYERNGGKYRLYDPGPWPSIGLGLRLWEGKFEGFEDTWLRWCDAAGEIILTGEERAAVLTERSRQSDERIRELEAELRRLKGEKPRKKRG